MVVVASILMQRHVLKAGLGKPEYEWDTELSLKSSIFTAGVLRRDDASGPGARTAGSSSSGSASGGTRTRCKRNRIYKERKQSGLAPGRL